MGFLKFYSAPGHLAPLFYVGLKESQLVHFSRPTFYYYLDVLSVVGVGFYVERVDDLYDARDGVVA